MVAKILVPLALSPIVAGLVALAATWVAYWLAACADRGLLGRFRAAQVVSASFVALARHQRRAEDDGRDHPDVDHCRSAACPLGTAALSSPPQASSSRWAPPQAAGGSSVRWTGGSATSRVPLALRRRAP